MRSILTAEQERQLIDAIASAFADETAFDEISIVCKAEFDAALAEAIEAAVPHARYRSGYNRGRFRSEAVKRVLRPLSKHFHTSPAGWWSVTPSS